MASGSGKGQFVVDKDLENPWDFNLSQKDVSAQNILLRIWVPRVPVCFGINNLSPPTTSYNLPSSSQY